MQMITVLQSDVLKNFKTVKVKFNNSGRLYTYKTRVVNPLVGDRVVVPVGYFEENKYEVATIISIDEVPDVASHTRGLRWIVDFIEPEIEIYASKYKKEVVAAHRLERAAILRQAKYDVDELGINSDQIDLF